MNAPVITARMARMLAAVAAERTHANVIPFPETRQCPETRRSMPTPTGNLRCDDPALAEASRPPQPKLGAGSSQSIPPRETSPVTLAGGTSPNRSSAAPWPEPAHQRSGHLSPLPPHRAPFQRPVPSAHVLIEAPQPQPLDPAKLEAVEWARRHRDGWDAVGVAVAISGVVMIAARCLPVLFPSLFN